jgi:hypothetical protein
MLMDTDLSQSTQVDGVLYRVHGYFFCRDSNEFKDCLSGLSTQQASSSAPIIPLEGVKSVDFDAFLSVLYPLYVCLQRACV